MKLLAFCVTILVLGLHESVGLGRPDLSETPVPSATPTVSQLNAHYTVPVWVPMYKRCAGM
jgi:hypothetical protein